MKSSTRNGMIVWGIVFICMLAGVFLLSRIEKNKEAWSEKIHPITPRFRDEANHVSCYIGGGNTLSCIRDPLPVVIADSWPIIVECHHSKEGDAIKADCKVVK